MLKSELRQVSGSRDQNLWVVWLPWTRRVNARTWRGVTEKTATEGSDSSST